MIYDDIIRQPGFFFRGVPLGASLLEVSFHEGEDYEAVEGSLSHYEYYFEVGDMEEVLLYYDYKKEEKIVTAIHLILKAYPKIYWKDEGGAKEQEFFQLVQEQQLAPYSTAFLTTKDQVINQLTNSLGTPLITEKDSVYSQAHQQFQKYAWKGKDGLTLTVSSYLDDLVAGRAIWNLHLLLNQSGTATT